MQDEYDREYKYWHRGIKSDAREKLLKEYEDGAKGNKMFSLGEKIEVIQDQILHLQQLITQVETLIK